jgi:drug/metabolite transporter (DMT)-like permease
MIQSVITAVLLVGLAVAFGRATVPTSANFWWAVLWLIVLASLGGYVMYVHVARTQGATIVSTLLYLTPPTTMVWAFLMFGVPLTLVAAAGLAVSAVGVVLVLRERRVRERVPVASLRRDRRSAAQRLPRSG